MDLTVIITFVVLFMLLILGVPIAFSLMGASLTILFLSNGLSLGTLSGKLIYSLDNYGLLSAPFFILAALIYSKSGAASSLINLASALTRKLPGGLAVSSILASGAFASISGTSTANLLAISNVMLPEMKKKGYPSWFAAGCLACSGTLGILIPPSVTMILYGSVTDTSINKLFVAGIVPGLLLILGLSLMTVWLAVRKGAYKQWENLQTLQQIAATTVPAADTDGKLIKAPDETLWKLFIKSIPALSFPIVTLGGIYLGLFTATESGAIGVVIALIVSILFYKKRALRDYWEPFKDSIVTGGMLFLLIAAAILFGHILIEQGMIEGIKQLLGPVSENKWLLMLFVNLLLIVLGMFLDGNGIVLIVAPIFVPLLVAQGFDPIQVGIMMTINLELGLITPPLGLNTVIVSDSLKLSIGSVFKGALPWCFVILLLLVLVIYFPSVSLWLPNLLTL